MIARFSLSEGGGDEVHRLSLAQRKYLVGKF